MKVPKAKGHLQQDGVAGVVRNVRVLLQAAGQGEGEVLEEEHWRDRRVTELHPHQLHQVGVAKSTQLKASFTKQLTKVVRCRDASEDSLSDARHSSHLDEAAFGVGANGESLSRVLDASAADQQVLQRFLPFLGGRDRSGATALCIRGHPTLQQMTRATDRSSY